MGDAATATSCSGPTSRRCGGCRGSSARRWWSPTWSGRTAAPVVASPRQILRRQLDRLAERGWTRQHRLRARVHAVPRQLRPGPGQALPRPRPRERLQRRLLDLRHDDGRGRAAADPAGHGRRRHHGRGLQGRVQLRPARGQLPLLRRARDGRQPLGLQERRQGDRLPARLRALVHGQVRRARGQLVPHPHEPVGRAAAACHPATAATAAARSSSTSSPASSPRPASWPTSSRPNVNSYKRYAWGSFAPTTLVWGIDNRTCALPGGRPRPGPAAGEPRSPGADVQPLPRLRRDDRRRPARHRQRARARARLPGQRLRRRGQAAAARQPARVDRAARGLRRSRGRRSATTSSTTTCTTRARSSARSRRRSPTGSGSAASSGCERAAPGEAGGRLHASTPTCRAVGR